MNRDEIDDLADQIAASDLFICVTMKRRRLQQAFYGNPQDVANVAFLTLLLTIEDIKSTGGKISHINSYIENLQRERDEIQKEKAPGAGGPL